MFVLVVIVIAVLGAFAAIAASNRTPEQQRRFSGYRPKPEVVCPHCQHRGKVETRSTDRKRGISGSKATGALLTGGISLLATGLSRHEWVTQAYCDNCQITWDL